MKNIKMRSILFGLVLIVATCILSGCVNKNPLPITKMEWEMATVQKAEDGTVVFCAESLKDIYATATIKSVSAHFEDTKIVITDNQSTQKWVGNYIATEQNQNRTTIYEVNFEGSDTVNRMISSITSTNNIKSGTLIVSNSIYILTFSAKLID